MHNNNSTKSNNVAAKISSEVRTEMASTEGEYRCPVCYAVIPPEHYANKVWCRRCGYLESCCNPE